MEIVKKIALIIVLSTNIVFNIKSDNPNDIVDQVSADFLNEGLTQAYLQLDLLNEAIQGLGFVINKNKIKIPKKIKPDVRNWIIGLQKKISQAKNVIEANISNNGTTNQILLEISDWIEQIILSIDKFFVEETKTTPDMGDLTLKPITKGIQVENNQILQKNKKNKKDIKAIQNKINYAGLSNLNLAVRKLEDVNRSWKILPRSINTVIGIIIGAVCLKAIPDENLPDGTRIKKIKHFIFGPDAVATPHTTTHNSLSGKLLNAAGPIFISEIVRKSMKNFLTETTLSQMAGFLKNFKNAVSSKYSELRGTENTCKHGNIEYSQITLDDKLLVGVDSQKEQLYDIVRYMSNPDIYDRAKTPVDKGVLLIGPSGCGKTYTAKALAGSINKTLQDNGSNLKIGFKEIKFSEIDWKKESIENIIESNKINAPIILFIDEVHLLGLQTEANGNNLNAFLTGMNKLQESKDSKDTVILMAATNRPDLLDPALLRAGRFGTIIRFEKPSYQARKKYFQVMLEEYAINSDNISTDELAKLTENCSHAQLENIMTKARFKAKTLAKGISSLNDILEVVNTEIRKIKNSEIPLTEQEKVVISAHQAGHTLIYKLLDTHKKIAHVTIKQIARKIKEEFKWDPETKARLLKDKKPKFGKLFTYASDQNDSMETVENKKNQIKTLLAGKIAEKLLLNTTVAYHNKDKHKAYTLAKEIIYDGLSEQSITKELKNRLDGQALTLLESLQSETEKLLADNVDKLLLISQNLQEKLILSSQEIDEIIA